MYSLIVPVNSNAIRENNERNQKEYTEWRKEHPYGQVQDKTIGFLMPIIGFLLLSWFVLNIK